MTFVGSTFRTDEPMLNELLDLICKGAIQLPDFQRGWVWDDEHIRSLIASISLSYPIGAVMLLETALDGINFQPRLVEGLEIPNPPRPDKLILDGQQRLTSLFLALSSGKPVTTKTEKGKETKRLYFLDMKACLNEDSDRIDAVISLPPEKILRRDFGREVELDVSTRELEFENGFFPLEMIFDSVKKMEWTSGYQKHFNFQAEKIQFLNQFEYEIWLRFQQYKVPVIVLVSETPKEAVCQVFEKVNTGGVTLSVFELMTATFAAENFRLRLDWEERKKQIHSHEVLKGIDATAFLTAITLYASYQRNFAGSGIVGCKRRDVLKLSLDDYKQHADIVKNGFMAAAKLLLREKIYDQKTLPYNTQFIPLACICAVLGERFEQDPIKRKLARWYWCGIFGELYGGANESRFALDLPEVIRWIDGDDVPRTIRDANLSPIRLLSLQSRQSAAYKGVMAQLLKSGSNDFLSGDPIDLEHYFDLAVDIHHIFPTAYCEGQSLPRSQWNSVINKAPLSARTNRIIGGRAPSAYLSGLTKNHEITKERLDEILSSHQIEPSFLWLDDFEGLIRDRAAKLLGLIENAMGKTVQGRESEEVIAAFGAPLLPSAPRSIGIQLIED